MGVVLIIVLIVIFLFVGGAEKERKDLIEHNKFKNGVDTTYTGKIREGPSKYEGSEIGPPE